MKIATIPNSCTADAARGCGYADYTTAAVGYASLARGLLFSKRLQRYAVAIGDLRVVGHCKPQALLWYRCQSTYWRRVAVQQLRIAAIFDGHSSHSPFTPRSRYRASGGATAIICLRQTQIVG